MRSELIPICVTSRSFDERFKFMWLNFRRDGRLMLCCNYRSAYPSDCGGFSDYLSKRFHIICFSPFTSLHIHYVDTNYRIEKKSSKWYFKVGFTVVLFSSSTKEALLEKVKIYFKNMFNKLE